eukprot:scaffold257761_cov16-Prasinocladus_malaysianus.AAC.1
MEERINEQSNEVTKRQMINQTNESSNQSPNIAQEVKCQIPADLNYENAAISLMRLFQKLNAVEL